MNDNLSIALANNTALLLALGIVYEIAYSIPARFKRSRPYISGLLIAGICLLIMMLPVRYASGITYDTRSILIGVTAMVFGAVPTLITVVFALIYRIFMGGIGTIPGVSVIISSALIGLCWRHLVLPRLKISRWLSIYLAGIVIHLVMLGCQLLLPYPYNLEVVRRIAIPVMIIYPIGTLLLSLLLIHQIERTEALAQKTEAEARYRSLFDNNHAIMLLIDPENGQIVEANPAAEHYYGWSQAELRQMNIASINTLTLNEIKEEMTKSFEEQRNQFFFRHRRANGEIRDVEVYSGPIQMGGHRLIYSIVHDISERVLAEKALKESETRFRSVVEGAPEAIFIQSGGYLTYLNQAALDLFGAATATQLIGTSVFDRFHPSVHELIRQRITTLIDNQTSAPALEEVFLKLDGTSVQVEVAAVPMNYNNQEGIMVFSRDITQRKQLEQEKQVVEAQMRHQQKLEAIGTLAGGVAHEINNPINGIMNYAQLVMDEIEPGSEQAVYLQGILSETHRVSEIVRNLLQFSRQDKQSHSYAKVVDIINQTISLIRTIIRKDQIDLQIDIPDDLPDVKCRSQQIQQVLMNLLTNARDALNERYPNYHEDKIIRVSCLPYVTDARRWMIIRVEDHGVGISEDVKQKMFEPFFSTKPKDLGTGLGLSISFGIVKDHHGYFDIKSEPRKATIIDLHLPVDNGWEKTSEMI